MTLHMKQSYRLRRHSRRLASDDSPAAVAVLSAPVRVREGEDIVAAYLAGRLKGRSRATVRQKRRSATEQRETLQKVREEAVLEAYAARLSRAEIRQRCNVGDGQIEVIVKRAELAKDPRVMWRRKPK